jgi:hypothetical protein
MFEGKLSLGDASFVVTDKAIRLTKSSNKWVNTTHFHVDYEIHMVLSGNAVIEIDGEDKFIKEGEICLLAPKSSHYPKNSSEDLIKPNFSFNVIKNYSHHNLEKAFSEYAYYDNIFKSIKTYAILKSTGKQIDRLFNFRKNNVRTKGKNQNEQIQILYGDAPCRRSDSGFLWMQRQSG